MYAAGFRVSVESRKNVTRTGDLDWLEAAYQ
jgi:hypothetical protein